MRLIHNGNEILEILADFADKISCPKAHWNVLCMKYVYFMFLLFVLLNTFIDIPGVRPIFYNYSPTEVLYAPPYYL